MSSFNISTGLISGLDFNSLIEAYSLSQQRAIERISARNEELEIKKTTLGVLESNLLAFNASVQTLKSKVTFEQLTVTNSQPSQLRVAALKTAQPGTYSFQALQQASKHLSTSRGFADATTQKVGAGTLTISQGGFIDNPTLLESLNDGAGVRRGSVRVTDRSGASAVIDLSRALTVNDVLDQFNNQSDAAVRASVVDGAFVLEDLSGQTATNLTVVDLNGGSAASDLGIRKSVANETLTGNDVYVVTENFNLSQINDGNNLRLLAGAEDMRISLADGTNLEVRLDGAITLKDVLEKINSHSGNNGKVTATLTDGRFVLTDSTVGAGTLEVTDLNDSTVVRQLGLNAVASGDTLTGNRLSAGMNSVLLRNLRGGQGISELGEISVTDRSGQTATLDLSSAETLNDIIQAINTATDDNTGERLFLKAEVNSQGNGIVITDTSGASDSNLIIADLAGSTLVDELKLTVNSAVDQKNSGSLALRYVNEATSLSKYAPDKGPVAEGLFEITDSAGNVGVISITSAAKNIGDVLQRINANTAISVRAELNETGDGFVLIDEAGGTGKLSVAEFGNSTTAADLRLLGTASTGGDGKQRITSRMVTQVEIDDDDTLKDVVSKLNAIGGPVTASTFNDGSTFNSTRLSISSRETGQANRLLIADGDLGLNFGTVTQARNAILQVGSNPASAYLITSSTNNFEEVVEGISVDVRDVGLTAASVELTVNTQSVVENLERFVSTYNQYIDISTQVTRFDAETNQQGILQGENIVLRASSRLRNVIVSSRPTTDSTIASLSEFGIRIGEGGKLFLDETRLSSVLNSDLEGVKNFFTDEENGFGKRMDETIKSLTDFVSGSFKLQKNSYDATIARTDERIETLNALLETRKTRLLNQFVEMENIISSLQSQQTALGTLSSIQAPASRN